MWNLKSLPTPTSTNSIVPVVVAKFLGMHQTQGWEMVATHFIMYRLILFNTQLQSIASTLTCSCMVTRQSWSTSNFLDILYWSKISFTEISHFLFWTTMWGFLCKWCSISSRSTVVVARRRVYSYHQHLCAAVLFLIGVLCSRKTMQRCALLNMNQLYFHNFRKKESKVWLCHTKK